MSGNVTIAPQKIQGSDSAVTATRRLPSPTLARTGPAVVASLREHDELYYFIAIIARSVNTGDPVTHADAA